VFKGNRHRHLRTLVPAAFSLLEMADETILDRMKAVLGMRGWSRRRWSREAGLAEETHVGGLMKRMESDPDRLAGDINTYTKLADAAHVSLDWLLLGRGTPNGMTIEVTDDPKYPTRARVIAAAHWTGIFGEAAIRAALAHNEPATDPGAEFWLRFLQLHNVEPGSAGHGRK